MYSNFICGNQFTRYPSKAGEEDFNMKPMYLACLTILIAFALQSAAVAQGNNATEKIKNYINSTVQKVEKEENVTEKRAILNKSFDKMIGAFDRISKMNIPDTDAEAIIQLKNDIAEKRNELNGMEGFKRVDDSNLNNFAHYVQDDFEQADRTIVIGVTTALLIVIILLLL